MPVHLFTEAERTRANQFPDPIAYEDLVAFFTLTEADQEQFPVHAAPAHRLRFALELCTLRFLVVMAMLCWSYALTFMR